MNYRTAICEGIIVKGFKEKCTFRLDALTPDSSLLIGIVDDEAAQKANGTMLDFSDSEYGGYGLLCECCFAYHGAEEVYFEYLEQFEYGQNSLLTMELDMTQQDNDHGILMVTVNSKVKDGVNIDDHSDILFDDIDINKKWRAAVAIYM